MNFKHLKRLLAVASFGVLSSMSAYADNPVTGQTLWANNCTGGGCHGTTPLTSNGVKEYSSRNARAWIQSNINSNNSGMGRLSGLTAQQVADVAAYVGNTPSTLTFASTNVGTTAAGQTVTVKASTKAGNAISALAVSASGDFARLAGTAGGTCGTALNTGLTCTVIVGFTPTAAGSRTGTLSISHSNTLTPIAIALSGTGAGAAAPAPIAGISPTSLALGSVPIGSTGTAQSVTVSNTGNANLTFTSITPSADFTIAGGTCSTATPVAAGSNCTVSVAFRPTAGATGARNGSLSIAHNAAGSPGAVTLSGTATAAPAPTTTLTSPLAFGSRNVGSASTAQTATLSNTGTAALTIGTLSTGSTEFAITGGTCAAGGTVATGGNCTVTLTFTPSTAGARSATLTVTHNATTAATTSTTASLSGTGIALSPVIGVSPTSLAFSQVINTTSTAQAVTVSNTGSGPLTISTLTLGGAQAAEFQNTGASTCTAGGTVAANASCTLQITFRPTATGARAGTLSIAHNATGSPSTITLNGTGTAVPTPQISLNASSLTFASRVVGTPSASQSVTVSNSGTAALNFSALTLTGTTSGDFTRGGTCTPTTVLAIGGTCTVTFTFTPAAVGTRSGTLTLVSDASNGSAVLSLTGSGSPAPAPTTTLTSPPAFGSRNVGSTSTAQTATLSNTGTAALTIGTLSTGSTEFAITGGSCVAGGTVAVAGNCTVTLTFTPSTAGARSATLTVTHNATSSGTTSTTSPLSGTGVALTPVIGVSPTNLTFSQVVNATSAAQTVTVSNSGTAALNISALTLGGAQSAEYQIGTGSTCAAGGSVAPNASCTVQITFRPTATGSRAGTLSIAHNATGSPSVVTLNGTSTAAPQPALSLGATTLAFGVQTQGASSASRSVTVSNSGSATLNFSALTLTGSAVSDFTRSGTCAAPGSLAAGATCTVVYTFTPSALGSRTATLTIGSNASGGNVVLSLSGTGSAIPAPVVSLSTASLAFGNQTVGVASTARSVTLTNSGSAALSISSIAATSGFGVTNNCGTSLAAAASCTLSVTFTPSSTGAASGSVSVASNAAGSFNSVSLTGTGVVSSPVLAWVPSTTTSVAFGDRTLGVPSTAPPLTLLNQGPGTVTLSAFTLAGTNLADFSVSSGGTCAVNVALAAGQSCSLPLAFSPGAVGARSAILQVASTGTNPRDVALSGNGTAPAQPGVALTPTALSFNAAAGAAAAEQTLTLQSNGAAVLQVTGLSIASGSFTLAPAATNGCATPPFALQPGQSCAVSIAWSSSAIGTETGSVQVDTNASATSAQVAITATRDALTGPSGGAVGAGGAVSSNAGGGGCSIAQGESLTDPTLLLLALLSIGVLFCRNRFKR